MWALLLACGSDLPPPPTGGTAGPLDATCGPGLSWEGFGQGFMLSYCTACHGSQVTGDSRHGAPLGVDFDTLAATTVQAERVGARVLDSGDMPPVGGPTGDELTLLAEWLDCGLPGTEQPLPAAGRNADLLMGYSVRIELTETDLGIEVARLIEAPSPDRREGLWRADTYTVDGDDAAYVGHTTWDASGELERSVLWDPPLVLLDGDEDQVVQATWTTPLDSWTSTETWVAQELEAPALDGHLTDPAAWAILLVSDRGDEHGWLLSPDNGIVGRWHAEGDERLDFQQLAGDIPEAPASLFPLDAALPWIESALIQARTP
jgi:hypothetical protein